MIVCYIGEALWMLAKCYVCYRLAKATSRERFAKQWISILIWSVFSGVAVLYTIYILYMTKLVGNYAPSMVACTVFILLSVVLFCNKQSLFLKIIGICLLFEIDDLTDYFTQTVLYVLMDNAGEGTPRLFQLIGTARGILLLFYAAALFALGGRIAWVYRKNILPTWLSTWKGLLPIGVFWFINRYFQRIYYQYENLVTNTYFFGWMLAFFTILIGIVVVWILHIKIRKSAEEKVQQIRYEALEQEIQRTKDNNQERRKLVHDIKGHLAILKNFLDREDTDGAKAYLQEILPENHGNYVYSWSGYQILDMVISLRVETAKKAGIRCDIMCDQIQELTIKDSDICSLIENLLTNAIEAQTGEFAGEKWIILEVRQNKNTLYIEVSNPFEHDIIWDHGKIRTRKKDTGFHGIGLSVVNQIVEKYGGAIDISTDNQIFKVRIMMRAAEEK